MTSLALTFWLRYDQAVQIGGVAVGPKILSRQLNLKVNVLAFGMSGTGKIHTLCAIGHRPVESEPNLIAQARFISERLLTLPLHNSASLAPATRVDRKRKTFTNVLTQPPNRYH